MFIDKYLTSKVIETQYESDFVDSDQMRYEKRLREKIAQRDLSYEKPQCKYYHYNHKSPFVDYSTFYSVLTYVKFEAVTYLISENDVTLPAVLWTYGAVTIWSDGEKQCAIDVPVYKPIIKQEFFLKLHKGKNEIRVVFQNLGVRDTRNLFAIDVKGDFTVTTGDEISERYAKWLDDTYLRDSILYFPYPAIDGTLLGRDSRTPDYGKVNTRVKWQDISGMKEIKLEDGEPYLILSVGGIKRKFEIGQFVKPYFPNISDRDENFKRMLGVIASADGLSRGDKFGFYIQNILARKSLGIVNKRDDEYFMTTLQQIEDRYDCSDFLISGVIRYMKNYEISSVLENRIKEVLQNYRYWMNMDGADAMCFWSENHSLLFYSCAMLVGQMYPDMYFPRAKMNGNQLSEYGKRLVIEWFDDVDEYGFEEFLSTVYMNVTFACLLNIIDYADEEVSKRAIKVTDKMLEMLSLHTFDGVVIAPMGRVYRGVINPSKQGAQALMNLINPAQCPSSFGEGWLSYYATSSYKLPGNAISLMNNPVYTRYSSGDSRIVLFKSKNYCLTSVESPRLDGFERWNNITLSDNASDYQNTHLYTKSFNERFHGTTFFEPGTYGYQQHMWMCALSNEAILFANHPGAFCDSSSMRPGYWYGNGVMPALLQEENKLYSIYRIPENHPVDFTHVHFPSYKFDSYFIEGNFLFARKNKSFLALYSSLPLIWYNDELADSELRAYGRENAYICFVNSEDECSFEEFKSKILALDISFDGQCLLVNNEMKIKYESSKDRTQFV